MLVFKTNKVANTLCIFGWILTVISAFYAVFAFLNDPLIGIAFLAAAALGLLLVGVAELIELIFKIAAIGIIVKTISNLYQFLYYKSVQFIQKLKLVP